MHNGGENNTLGLPTLLGVGPTILLVLLNQSFSIPP